MKKPLPTWDGHAFFLQHLDLIEQVIRGVCYQCHARGEEAADFASAVKLKLIENDYQILRVFEGRSSLETYLYIVIRRLRFDQQNAAYGKWHPSAQAVRDGDVAVLLERLLVRDGFSFEEACEIILTNHRLDVTRSELERLRARLPPRTRRKLVSDETLDTLAAPGTPADERAAGDERQAEMDRLMAALREAIKTFDLVEDRLLLESLYSDGTGVADVGRLLHYGRKETKQLYRRRKELCSALRKLLEARGFKSDLVREILDKDRQ